MIDCPWKFETFYRALLFGTLLLAATGCSVLTQSQVRAVGQFADATKNYGTLPGGVIEAYAEIRLTADVLKTPELKDQQKGDATRTWDRLVTDRQFEADLATQANRANHAVNALDTYANLLQVLSSDKFTDALDKSAANLGDSLDNAIKTVNKEDPGANLQLLGSTAAEIVSGLGRIYLRYKQEQLLKFYVTKGDLMVSNLTVGVENLLQGILEPQTGQTMGKLDAALDTLRSDFVDDSVLNKQVSLDLVLTFSDAILKVQNARDLAEKALHSAQQCRVAHHKLAEAMNHPESIKAVIEQIQSLAAEVKAAQKVKSDMDKKKP